MSTKYFNNKIQFPFSITRSVDSVNVVPAVIHSEERGFACCLHGLLFDPEDGSSTLVRDVPDYTVWYSRRQ
jgi:hypothetical protein